MIEPLPGIEIDPEAKTFVVLGQPLIVANLEHTPYSPIHIRDRAATDPWMVEYFEKRDPAFFDRPAPAFPEAIHVTFLCGENGWWLEAHIYPGGGVGNDGGTYGPGMQLEWPAQQFDDGEWFNDGYQAEDLLLMWRKGCARRDAPPAWQDDKDPGWPGPYSGYHPGTWVWNE